MNKGDEVWDTQRMLTFLGVYNGRIDGLYGQQTRSAIDAAAERFNQGNLTRVRAAALNVLREIKPTSPRLTPLQCLLDINRYCDGILLSMPEQKAIISANIWKETGGTMMPVVEAGFASPAKQMAYLRKQAYYPHFGFGDLQFTWEENHFWVSSLYTPASYYVNGKIPLNVRTNFVVNKAGLLTPTVSLPAAIIGMLQGVFRRNHCIKRYVNEDKIDFYNGRKIVNGLVPKVAKEIAEKAEEHTEFFKNLPKHF